MKPGALSQVPIENHARLSERLELYVRSVNAHDLDEIYALTPTSCTHGLNKETWLKQVQVKTPGLMSGFYVDEVYAGDYTLVANADGEKWIATGCGTYEQGIKTVKYKALISLVMSENEWYICGSGVAIEGKHDRHIQCSVSGRGDR